MESNKYRPVRSLRQERCRNLLQLGQALLLLGLSVLGLSLQKSYKFSWLIEQRTSFFACSLLFIFMGVFAIGGSWRNK